MNINDSRSNALSGNDVVFTKDHTDSGHLKNCKNEAQLCPGQEVKGINLSRTGNVAFRTESLMLDSMGEDSNSDVFIHRNGKASVASKTAEDAMIFKDSKTLAQEQRAQERKDAAAEEVEKKNKQVETCEAAKKGDLEALATLKSEGFDPKIIAKIEEANKKQELVDREKDMRALEDKVGKATKLSQMKELIAEIEEFANNNDALKERSVELLNELADKAMEFEIEKDSDFRKSTGVALEAYAAIKRLEPSYEGLKKKIADVKAGRLIDRARNAGYSNDLDELSRVQAEAHKEYRNALRAGMRSRRSDSASNEAANVFRQVIQQREIEVRKPSAKEPNGYKIMGNNLDRAYADSLTRAEGKTVSEMQHDYSYGSLTNTPYTNQNRQDSRFP